MLRRRRWKSSWPTSRRQIWFRRFESALITDLFMASELYNTIDALSREKGIDPQIVVSAVEDAIVVATRKYYKTQENLRAELDKETGKIRAFAVKTIVETPEQVEDPNLQVTVEQGRKLDPRAA